MRTMIKIEGYHNGILGMYDKSEITSLTQNVDDEVASVKLVTGEYIKFEDVTNIDEEDIYEEGELEAIIKNREIEMANNPILQERQLLNQTINQNMDVMLNNSLRQMAYGFGHQPPIYQPPMYQQQYQPQPNTCDTRYAERRDMYNTPTDDNNNSI